MSQISYKATENLFKAGGGRSWISGFTKARAPPTSRMCALAAALSIRCAQGCLLAGQDIGVCIPSKQVQEVATFCAPLLRYPSICSPAPAIVSVGIGLNVSAAAAMKDKWLANAYMSLVAQRQAIEEGTLAPNDPSKVSYVAAGDTVTRRFTASGGRGADCAGAYKAYACWLAFPRCDGSRHSLPICRSVCENFFKACSYPRSMWRCYDPAFFGGEAAEGTTGDQLFDALGNAVFKRAPIAGLPFVDNANTALHGDELAAMCTPALLNGIAQQGVLAVVAAVAALILTLAAATAVG